MRSELSHNGIKAGRLSLPQAQLKRCASERTSAMAEDFSKVAFPHTHTHTKKNNEKHFELAERQVNRDDLV